jgi:hypothetical protein
VPMGMPRAGARSIPWGMFYGQFFMQSKRN